MSTRNPKTGKRAKVKPGDRLVYTLPPGPPAEAIERFGGDVQAAVTAALTILAFMATGAMTGTLPVASVPEPPRQSSSPDPLAAVMTQPLYS